MKLCAPVNLFFLSKKRLEGQSENPKIRIHSLGKNYPMLKILPLNKRRNPITAKTEASVSIDGCGVKDNWRYRPVTVFSS